MKKLNLALAVLAFSAASTAFAAPTGLISFTGKLLDGTCTATVVGGTAANGSFTLPTMNVADLATATATAGDIPFTIKLTGTSCEDTAASLNATPYFEYEASKVNAAGRLINTAATTPADKVDIQIVTADKVAIDLTKPATTQEETTSTSGGTNAKDFKYYARYYAAEKDAVKGNVTASVSYSISYK